MSSPQSRQYFSSFAIFLPSMCVLFVHVDARCVVRPHRVHGAFFTDSEGGFGFLFLYDFFFKSASVAIGMALSLVKHLCALQSKRCRR